MVVKANLEPKQENLIFTEFEWVHDTLARCMYFNHDANDSMASRSSLTLAPRISFCTGENP